MTDSNYTHLALIVDRSGSMRIIADDMNGAIRQLLADQAKQPGYVKVDITTFDTDIETPYVEARPDDVKNDVIVPRGATALNDAIGSTIVRLGERFAALPEDERPDNVIVVVVTDGAENSSKEYTTKQVQLLVEQQQDQWGWTFIYLAANVDAFATGGAYGFNKDQSIAYAASSVGATRSFAAASNLVTRTRSGLDVSFTDEERQAASGL